MVLLMAEVSPDSLLNFEKLEKRRKAGDLAGVVDIFRGSREADRSVFEKPVLAAERLARRGEVDHDQWDRAAWEASLLAVLACASWGRLRNFRWNVGGPHFGDAEWSPWWREALRLVAEQRPAWADDWAEVLLKQNLDHWFFVRELVREGLCHAPASDAYTLGMLRGLHWRFHTYVPKKGGGGESRYRSIADAILDDPGLLQDELWRLFRVAGTSKCNVQSLEPTQGTNWKLNTKIPADTEKHSWRYAIVWLADKGQLPRGRLLDESLAALNRGFEPHHAGWYCRLHDALEPTTGERAARLEKYLLVLASPHPNLATWALQTVADLDQEHPLPAAPLVKQLAPAFALESKTSVKIALKLAGRAAAREPRHRGELLMLATQALACNAAEVQGMLLKLLDELGRREDAALAGVLAAQADKIAPSLRARLSDWQTAAGRSSPPLASKPKIAQVPSTAPLDASGRQAPISHPEELFERIAFALDHPDDIDEVERVLAGLVRLGNARPSGFAKKSEALGRHIIRAGWEHLTRRPEPIFAGQFLPKGEVVFLNSVPRLLGALLESWRLSKDLWPKPGDVDELNQTQRFLFQRLRGINALIQRGVTLPLLSAPTHRGGWIDPVEFAKRLEAWHRAGEACEEHDFCLALLRLAAENRAPALGRLQDVAGEAADAARHALGDEGSKSDPRRFFGWRRRGRVPLSSTIRRSSEGTPGWGPTQGVPRAWAGSPRSRCNISRTQWRGWWRSG